MNEENRFYKQLEHGGEITIGPNGEEIEVLDIDEECRAVVALTPSEIDWFIKALKSASE